MKFGLRKPSWKKMLKARTTSKWKRQIKKAVIPGYGKKGLASGEVQRNTYIIKRIKELRLIYSNC